MKENKGVSEGKLHRLFAMSIRAWEERMSIRSSITSRFRFSYPLIIGCAVVVVIILIVIFFGMKGEVISSYPISKHIRYSYTLQNRTNRVESACEFWTYAPVKKTATQKSGRITTSHPYTLITDDLGNQILKFTFPEIGPYETKIISIDADVSLAEKPNHLWLRKKDIYIKSEPFIESDRPEMLKQAKVFKTMRTGKSIEKIFPWVSQNVRYVGYVSNERGALYTLNYKEGDCTEYTDLFVALCRANKIPARALGGYICPSNTTLKPAMFHNWAEFYNGTWRIADPQNKVLMQNNADYIAMKIISRQNKSSIPDFERFFIKGTGLYAHMN